jgi:hypothetical protein
MTPPLTCRYKGLRRERAKGEEYDSFVAEFMNALQQWQPHVLLQFEDFGWVTGAGGGAAIDRSKECG